jgi:ATP-dependent exoDNAse (exonuclease V) beta subunit
MTVHGAKGLTKRVCFVPDSSFGDNTEPGFAMFSPQGTLEMKISGLAAEEVKSPGWSAAREADKAVRDLESTNVFYVAMTRARDLVVLSGAGTKDSKGWLKLSEAFLEQASADILCKRDFAEVPVIETGLKPETGNLKPEIGFVPLEIPSGIERKTVTSLCEHSTPATRHSSLADPARYGTAGHAVLEELAKNGWYGDIQILVEQAGGASLSERAVLVEQLEAAREILREETAGASALFAEHPFVLLRDAVILDGTMDLLAQFPGRLKILDYKFTDEPPENALTTYAPQLEAYCEAVQKLQPGAEVSAALLLIGKTVRVISLRR